MKLLWFAALANMASLSFGIDLLGAEAKTCVCDSECPQLTCQTNKCSSGFCKYTVKPVGSKCAGQSCTNGGLCDDDANDYCNDKAECISAFKPSTTECRPAGAGSQCDVPEYCTGSSGSCPIDAYAPLTTACTGTYNGGPCDAQDFCNGFGRCVDMFLPSTTVCRASKGQCDVDETCTGTAGACPIDVFQSTTTTCTGANNGGACDDTDKCDGKGSCVDNYLPSTTVCRASAGQCDVAESCTGSSSACPADAFASVSVKCSGSSTGGVCDVQDYCDGKGACADKYQDSSYVCRASKGQCDVAETCTGSSGSCPDDGYAPATMTCAGTSSGNPCDGVDKCDGKGNCVDVFLPSTTVCRKAAGECDVAETCTGTGGQCPTDAFASTSTTCTGTSKGNPCDGQDLCDGKGNCVDVFSPSSTICRAAADACDVAEYCSGTAASCPANSFAASTVTCTGTANGERCDGVDKCDGKGNCVDNFLPSGTVCGPASSGPCIIVAVCDGTTGFCPPNDFAKPGVNCTGQSSGGICDDTDSCDGSGNCVDRFLSGKAVCKNSVGRARPIYCDGKQATCPAPKAFLDAAHLREDLEVESPEQLLALRPSSPVLIVGLVCAVAAVVAIVTLRSRREVSRDSYMAFDM